MLADLCQAVCVRVWQDSESNILLLEHSGQWMRARVECGGWTGNDSGGTCRENTSRWSCGQRRTLAWRAIVSIEPATDHERKQSEWIHARLLYLVVLVVLKVVKVAHEPLLSRQKQTLFFLLLAREI